VVSEKSSRFVGRQQVAKSAFRMLLLQASIEPPYLAPLKRQGYRMWELVRSLNDSFIALQFIRAK
jgi:hypothetical protein